jgi:hypothetical protein
MTRKDQIKSAWFACFETAVCTLEPKLTGRIVWSEVQHFFHACTPVSEAAARYVASHPVETV